MRFTAVFYAVAMLVLAQQPPARTPADPGAVIKTETRLVLVDTVVTDKKGNYLRDLASKDFRVWEDNKEQTVKSFSFEADPASPSNSQKRYLVLFFDDSTMETAGQARARQAAEKFIDGNAGANHLTAIVNFGGSVRIAQNFTADADRLKKAVHGIKFSAVSPNAPAEVVTAGMPRLNNAESDFGARSVLLALRSLARNLATVPGRKTLVLFTSGFPLTQDNRSEVTAVIDVCNKSNVAIYPIDVRGLVASTAYAPRADEIGTAQVRTSLIRYPFGASFVPQRSGGAGGGGAPGGGGGAPGGGAAGGRGGPGGGSPGAGGSPGMGRGGNPPVNPGGNTGGGRVNPSSNPGNPGGGGRAVYGGGGQPGQPHMGQPYSNGPFNQPRQIVPQFPENSSINQQVLYQLAEGTGGFVISNTNDLLGGLMKIGKEQNEHYILGYTPTDSPQGSCHTLRVKVDRGGTVVRARSGYCNARPVDLLAGNPIEKDLESRLSAKSGTVNAAMRVPFFYTAPNTARVNVAMEIPLNAMNVEKVKGKFHVGLNILGVAYGTDGGVAARFSDAVKLDFTNKKEMEAAKETPIHYENQFEIASGQYVLKVVFQSGGESFGKLETPLVIEPFDGHQFSISALAISTEVLAMSDGDIGRDVELLEGRTPLATNGMQVIPAGSEKIEKKKGAAAIYVEIYEPGLLGPGLPMVAIQLRVVDRKSGEAKHDSGLMNVASWIRKDNAVIPVILKMPLEPLATGTYRAEVKAINSVGHASQVRAADFELQ